MQQIKVKTALSVLCILFLTVLSTSVLSATESFTYDANGNLIHDPTKCYEYNDANHLSKVTNCRGTILGEYWYDYAGRKIKAIEDGITINYPFPDYEVRNYPDGTKETINYLYANGELVARQVKNRQGITKKYFYHPDHLGSTATVTDEQGNVVEKVAYYPFGKTRSRSPEDSSNTRLYNGKELSKSTGLYDYGARPYNPDTIHFTQPDTLVQNPYDPQTLNRYSYAKNNPIKYSDPSGHYVETALDITFISMDLNDIQNDPGNAWNYGALVADIGGAILPGATGGRLIVKGVEYGGDIRRALEISGKAEKGVDAVKTAEKAEEVTGKAIKTADETNTYTHYGYSKDADSLRQNGLNVNPSYATPDKRIYTAEEAQSVYGLKGPYRDSYYRVTPASGDVVEGPWLAKGGTGSEVRFPRGTSPGTVAGPYKLPTGYLPKNKPVYAIEYKSQSCAYFNP